MLYVTGVQALNLPCSLDTTGDWHTSAQNWSVLNYADSSKSILGDYGIETCNCVPEHNGTFYIANTLRALLDLLLDRDYPSVIGCREDYICNEKYTQEFLGKVWELRSAINWDEIDNVIGKEYLNTWLKFKAGKYV